LRVPRLRYTESMRSLVAMALIGVMLAVAEGAPGADQQRPRPVVLRQPGYTTVYWVQRSLIRNGVRQGSRLRAVRTATCTGAGPRRWKDRFGWLYHEFTCAVSTAWDRLAHAKVVWWSDNTYRYDFFGCKPRGCR
jgi:hypothetical protein